MGTFGGHALPGGFFIVFAVWWTVQIFRRYFSSRRKCGVPFKATVTYPADFIHCGPVWLRRWEWEGFFKVFFTLVGFLGEIITAREGGRFAHIGNGQHATMFFFFGMSGMVDILVHHRAPLPDGIEYLMGCLAFIVEAVLFKFHLHGRTELDVLLHTLLLYVVYANIIITALEMRYRHSVTVALARAFTVLLQGTWFWQAGFVLYNPVPGALPWDQDDHEQMMVVTMIFAWHMAAIFILMISIGAAVAACQSRGGANGAGSGSTMMGDVDSVRLLRQNGKLAAATAFDAELDSDSDTVDFERTLNTVRSVDDAIQ